MAGFVIAVTLGDEEFRLDRVTVKEVDKVCGLTSYKNKREWFDGITAEEPKATIAAYIIAKARQGVKVRWEDVDFDDDVNARFVDDAGREVQPKLEMNDDGTVKTFDNGLPVPVMRNGSAVWVYSDTGEEVPPPEAEVASPPTSAIPPTPGSSSGSDSGTPTTSPS